MGRPKKIPKIDFYPRKIHLNAMAFCLSNGIKIMPELIKANEIRLNIRIEENGLVKNMISPVTYSNNEVSRPIYEIYLTYFKRMASEEIIKKSNDNYLSFNNNN
jgi:hypothetical protein